MQWDGRSYHINSINKREVRIGARILASKIVHGNRPIQCNSRVVAYAQQCAEGVQMSWSLLFLNQLTEDEVIAHVRIFRHLIFC